MILLSPVTVCSFVFFSIPTFANDLVQLSTIWAETSDNARSAARSLVLGGLSEKHHGLNNFWVADRINVRTYLELSSLQYSETNPHLLILGFAGY